MNTHLAGSALRRIATLSAQVVRPGLSAGLQHLLPSPPPVSAVPEGRLLDLPERGKTFLIDVAGPGPSAPAVVLLHSLGCTAYLSWAASLGELSRHYRVITFDQRWHGRGIRSSRLRFEDCADDVASVMDQLGVDRAVIAGYSMGGAVAQLTWLRHRRRVAGLVLCSTARNFRGTPRERLFFLMLTAAMQPLSGYALAQVDRLAHTLPPLPSIDASDPVAWGRLEFRSTSAWSLPEAVRELGRFNSAPWIDQVDVPTAVVVTAKDHTIPARRQRRLAAAIDGAHVHTAPAGHASLVLDTDNWVPVFLDAIRDVTVQIPSQQRMSAPGAGGDSRSA